MGQTLHEAVSIDQKFCIIVSNNQTSRHFEMVAYLMQLVHKQIPLFTSQQADQQDEPGRIHHSAQALVQTELHHRVRLG